MSCRRSVESVGQKNHNYHTITMKISSLLIASLLIFVVHPNQANECVDGAHLTIAGTQALGRIAEVWREAYLEKIECPIEIDIQGEAGQQVRPEFVAFTRSMQMLTLQACRVHSLVLKHRPPMDGISIASFSPIEKQSW